LLSVNHNIVYHLTDLIAIEIARIEIGGNGKITGTTTATNTGTLGVTLSDGTNYNTTTLNIVPIDPALVDNNYNEDKTFVYGTDAISSVNLNNAMTFFEPDENNGVPYLGVITLNGDTGTYGEYKINANKTDLIPPATNDFETFTLTDKNTTSVNATATSWSEKFTILSAKNVTSINNIPTAGLIEAMVQFTTRIAGTVENTTDWWESHYTIDNVPITNLAALKNSLIANVQYGQDVWMNGDVRVTIAGDVNSTSGNVIGMSWDGTYNQCTGTDCGSPYYKHMISTGTTVGTWTLDNNYLKVNVPNVGTTAFKIQNDHLMQTEVRAVDSTDTDKWYFGPTLDQFKVKYLEIENNATK